MQDKMLAFWTNEIHSCGADKARGASVSPGLQVQSTCNMGGAEYYDLYLKRVTVRDRHPLLI